MIVGLVPAAGHATRLGPQPCSKEVLPVGGRPVMDHLVERMRAGGAEQIRVVTRPDKRDVDAHARALGAVVVHGTPADVSASLRLALDGLPDDDVVLIGFPDTLWEPLDGYARLVEALDNGAAVALGLFRTPDVRRSDVVVVDDQLLVVSIVPKPEDPPSDLIWGIAATTCGLLRTLPEGTEPGAWISAMAGDVVVAGRWMSDTWLDIGLPEALARARAEAAGPPVTGE